ncbi:hypothetical protein D9613_010096 [Agrocybe pediades]|uniref:F-box domain-containing protein n=1 Tax=Agrocybe pediades TaxID=84607 RepID=A0A8H4QWP2_9AGAR|nr:hypothetical protein D9613_010096 [Agrocybe pediades]
MILHHKDFDHLIIPQELNDHIIGFLLNDRESLKTCSLVCRSWLKAAYPYLFRTLFIDQKLFQSSAPDSFLSFPSSCFHAMNYVREAKLSISSTLLQTILMSRSCCLAWPPTLTRLHLYQCHFDRFSQLCDLIGTFPHLERLALERVEWDSEQNDTGMQVRDWSPSSLIRLQLKETRMSRFLGWLSSSSERHITTHLELLGPIREEDVPAICRYLIQTSSSLRYMAVSFEKQDLANGSNWHLPILNHALVFPGLQPPKTSEIAKLYDRHFGLPLYPTPSIMNALETLRIEGFIDCLDSISGECDYARSQAAFWATRILSKIESPHLFRGMVLQLVLGRAGDLDMCDVRWDFFDEAMSGSIFSNFEYLEFEIVGRKLQLDAVVSLLSLRLPRLAAGGRLRFSLRYDR